MAPLHLASSLTRTCVARPFSGQSKPGKRQLRGGRPQAGNEGVNEELLAKLRQAEEEAQRLKAELAAAKTQVRRVLCSAETAGDCVPVQSQGLRPANLYGNHAPIAGKHGDGGGAGRPGRQAHRLRGPPARDAVHYRCAGGGKGTGSCVGRGTAGGVPLLYLTDFP